MIHQYKVELQEIIKKMRREREMKKEIKKKPKYNFIYLNIKKKKKNKLTQKSKNGGKKKEDDFFFFFLMGEKKLS